MAQRSFWKATSCCGARETECIIAQIRGPGYAGPERHLWPCPKRKPDLSWQPYELRGQLTVSR